MINQPIPFNKNMVYTIYIYIYTWYFVLQNFMLYSIKIEFNVHTKYIFDLFIIMTKYLRNL